MRSREAMSDTRYRQFSDADSRAANRELSDLVTRGVAEMLGGGATPITCSQPAPYTTVSVPAAVASPQIGDRRPEIRRLLEQHEQLSRAELLLQPGLGPTPCSRLGASD
jgi:hypothetical protein